MSIQKEIPFKHWLHQLIENVTPLIPLEQLEITADFILPKGVNGGYSLNIEQNNFPDQKLSQVVSRLTLKIETVHQLSNASMIATIFEESFEQRILIYRTMLKHRLDKGINMVTMVSNTTQITNDVIRGKLICKATIV